VVAFGVAASAAVCAQAPSSGLPVTRLSGGGPLPAPAQQTRSAAPKASTQLPDLPVTRLDDRLRSTDLDASQRLTLAFAAPVPIRDVLLLLVRGTPFSLAVAPAVTGTFVGELKDVTLRQAIDAVLVPAGFGYEVDGTVIRAFPRRADTRLFDLNVLPVRRTWQRTLEAGDSTLTSRVPDVDALDEAAEGIRSLLTTRGTVHVDRRTGLAQVTDYPDRLDRVAAYVEALQVRGSRQIRLQARILQVTPRGAAGIDWAAVRQQIGVPAAGASAGVAVDAASVQRALASEADVELLASPDLLALNNEPATVRTVSRASSLTLTVVPQITAGGIVQLSVSPSWSSSSIASDTDAARADADTVVRVANGSTAVIAGLLRTTTAVGGAAAVQELVVLLTPTVVNAVAAAPGAR
jgi:type II secretory pathway component GspD/PulD (secretin)